MRIGVGDSDVGSALGEHSGDCLGQLGWQPDDERDLAVEVAHDVPLSNRLNSLQVCLADSGRSVKYGWHRPC